MNFNEMSDNQRRVFIDAAQIYEAYMEAFWQNISYRGSMLWKKVGGKEYLFRLNDRHGNGKSLGVRSESSEKIFSEFHENKWRIKERFDGLKQRLEEQARFCKAALIQRVPRICAKILRLSEQHRILGKNIVIIGTNALYAYESAAGVFTDRSVTATQDADILWDIRPKLCLAADGEMNSGGFIGLLRKADKTFEPVRKYGFRAVNKDGYMVDLIKPEPRPAMKKERQRMGGSDDLEAVEIRNLQWLISSPKFTQTVIGDDGFPATMIVPDPRSFVLHKLWLSQQTDREPLKKKRDFNQAGGVAHLIMQYLPEYRFEPSELRMFPKHLIDDWHLFATKIGSKNYKK